MLVGVDVGYHDTKVVTAGGTRLVFPSVVAPEVDDVFCGLVERRLPWSVSVRQGDAEAWYKVGKAALNAGGARAWEEDPSTHPHYRVLLVTALAAANPDGAPVRLAVGLPLGRYRRLRRRLASELAGLSASVRLDEGAPCRVLVEGEPLVLPQGLGAYFAAAAADESLAEGAVGVVDVGGNTTDFTLLRPSEVGPQPADPPASDSIAAGMNMVYQLVARQVENDTGQFCDPQRIEESLRWGDGRLYVYGRPMNLRDLFERAAAQVADRIVSQLKQRWGQELPYLRQVLVAGGGGAALYPFLAERIAQARLLEHGQFANADGFLSVLMAQAAGSGSWRCT